MQEWLDNNNLMYSTHNEGRSVIAEIFIKILKAKIYKKMTANDSKSHLSYFNKLVDQYNNSYHCSNNIWLKKLRPIFQLLRLKLMTESELLSIRIFLVNVKLKIAWEKYYRFCVEN